MHIWTGKSHMQMILNGDFVLQAALQAYCKRLNEVRTEILEDLKTGFVKLPVEVIRSVENRSPGKLVRFTFKKYNVFKCGRRGCHEFSWEVFKVRVTLLLQQFHSL
jgi:hypothetical protein